MSAFETDVMVDEEFEFESDSESEEIDTCTGGVCACCFGAECAEDERLYHGSYRPTAASLGLVLGTYISEDEINVQQFLETSEEEVEKAPAMAVEAVPAPVKLCRNGRSCRFGASCRFSHNFPAMPTTVKLCRNGRSCRFGASCRFSHDFPVTATHVKLCRNGPSCRFGASCRFSHDF